jgi:hypothetical protein
MLITIEPLIQAVGEKALLFLAPAMQLQPFRIRSCIFIVASWALAPLLVALHVQDII